MKLTKSKIKSKQTSRGISVPLVLSGSQWIRGEEKEKDEMEEIQEERKEGSRHGKLNQFAIRY